MGLDMYCDDENFHITYSGVHSVRYNILIATLKYVKNNRDKLIQYYKDTFIRCENDYESQKEYIIEKIITVEKYLNDLITPSSDDMYSFSFSSSKYPNYKKINNEYNEALKMFGIYGIIPIIYHSDYDGYYTTGEVKDFMDVLKNIYIYIPSDDFHKQEIILEEYYMYDILKKSIDTNKSIIFA